MGSDSDTKSIYSTTAKYYLENAAQEDFSYDKSKRREARHNDDWLKQQVNINDVVDEFASDCTARENHQKLIFQGTDYNVIADLAGGYLRIYSNKNKTYVKLDGKPGTESETHFKIKKREEM